MDRVQNYNLQTPLTADDLNKERDYTAIALGKIVSALLGQSTVVSDLTATAVASTSVPTVQLSDGQLYELATLDPTAFGSLPVKSFPSIATVMKQGLLLASRGDTNTFELTPPGTSGESIIYLLEAQYADLDTDTQTITFYNASDPTNPTTATQPRVREGTISFVLKAGIASSSPTAPSADAGYVPLYNIEVAYGQTVLSQSNITVASGAPFLSQKLFGLMNGSGTVDVPALTASGLITANDGINVAGGTLTIPNATASNQAVALGQFAAPVFSDNYVTSPANSTTYSTTVSFVPPCDGTALMLGFLTTGGNANSFTSTQLLLNGSVVGTADNTNYPITEVATPALTPGGTYTLTFETTTPSSGTTSFSMKLAVIFIPN